MRLSILLQQNSGNANLKRYVKNQATIEYTINAKTEAIGLKKPRGGLKFRLKTSHKLYASF